MRRLGVLGKVGFLGAIVFAGSAKGSTSFSTREEFCFREGEVRDYELKVVNTIPVPGPAARILSPYVNAQGQIIVTLKDGSVQVSNPETGRVIKKIRPPTSGFVTPPMPYRLGFVVGSGDGKAYFYDPHGTWTRTEVMRGRFDALESRIVELGDDGEKDTPGYGSVGLVTLVRNPDLNKDEYQVTIFDKVGEVQGGFVSSDPIKSFGRQNSNSEEFAVCTEFSQEGKSMRRVLRLDRKGKFLAQKVTPGESCLQFAKNGKQYPFVERKLIPGVGSIAESYSAFGDDVLELWNGEGQKVGRFEANRSSGEGRPSVIAKDGRMVILASQTREGHSFITAVDLHADQKHSLGNAKVKIPTLRLREQIDSKIPPHVFVTTGGRQLISVYSLDRKKMMILELGVTKRHKSKIQVDCPVEIPSVSEEQVKVVVPEPETLHSPEAVPGSAQGLVAQDPAEGTPYRNSVGPPVVIEQVEQIEGPITHPYQVDPSLAPGAGVSVPPATTP